MRLCVHGKAVVMAVACLEMLAVSETSWADGVYDRTLSAPGRQRNGYAVMETRLQESVCECVRI